MIERSEQDRGDDKDFIVITDVDPAAEPTVDQAQNDPAPDTVPPATDPRTADDELELHADDAPVVVRAPTVALGAVPVQRRPAERISAVSIPGSNAPVKLDDFNIWDADRFLRAGVSPQQAREEQADVLVLGKRNGVLLWVITGLCATLILGTFLNVYLALSKPAKGIPSTEQVGIYTKAVKSREEVEAFAERVSSLMEFWKAETIEGHPRRVVPYLDPSQRAKWETDFVKATSDAHAYKERSLYETVALKYRGITNEVSHQVFVYYQVYRGRGEQEGMIRFDATVRRVKVLYISEGAITEENTYGMYVTRLIDIPERAYLSNERFAMEPNPWDIGLGIKPKKKKPTTAEKEQKK